jgi:CheY-like chemotaxis protein
VLNLNTTLRDFEKMLRRLLTENITLEQILATDLAATKIDAGQLEQVVMNLVVNARDAMPNGGHLTIETHNVALDESYIALHPEAQTGEHVVLVVSDTGHGMDSYTLEHVFEPFFTTKPQGRGTGLGLSTVYGIVSQAGGHVTTYSEQNRGTSFRVYLPAVRESVSSTMSARPESAPPGGSETLLVCEDDDAVRDLTARTLIAAGYNVLVAGDATQALQLAAEKDRSLDLLVTDVIMPDMNGQQLSKAMADVRPGIRTLFVSGYTSDVIAHHGVLEKTVDFLEKPYSRRQLLCKIREILDRVIATESESSVG